MEDELFCKTSPQNALNHGLVSGANDELVAPAANKIRTWPILGPVQLLELVSCESLGEEYLLTSACSFIANELSYRVSLNSSKTLESEMFKILSGRAIENVIFMA